MKIASLTILILLICNFAFAEEEYVHFGREIPQSAKFFDKKIKKVHKIVDVRTIVLNEINNKTDVKNRIRELLSEGVFKTQVTTHLNLCGLASKRSFSLITEPV